MEQFIPYEKLSKKTQKELNAKMRNIWYGISPVTRKSKNGKAYDRKKARNWSEYLPDRACYSVHFVSTGAAASL